MQIEDFMLTVGARFIAPGEPDAWHEGAMNRARRARRVARGRDESRPYKVVRIY